MSFLFDSDVLIRSLRGSATAEAQRLIRDNGRAISRITWMEVMAGTGSASALETRDYLFLFFLLEINSEIAERTVRVRRETRLKLPDAIIYATALATHRTLVTYNTRDFDPNMPAVLIPS